MRKFILSLIIFLTSWIVGSAGSLNMWSMINFKGIWEINAYYPDNNLSWLLEGLVNDLGSSPISKAELALDSNGWGYIAYESEEVAGIINICGTIFTTNSNRDYSDVLSFLCRQGSEAPISGIRSICVGNPNNGNVYPEERGISLHSMDRNYFANMKRISTEYTPASVYDINCASMQIQFHQDGISVVDAEGTMVSVYGIDGTLYYQTQSYKGETIKLPRDAVYIVKANDNSMKVAF